MRSNNEKKIELFVPGWLCLENTVIGLVPIKVLILSLCRDVLLSQGRSRAFMERQSRTAAFLLPVPCQNTTGIF